MKKIFAFATLVAALLFAGNANAQLGIHVGYSPETWSTDNNGTTTDLQLNSFIAGVDYNVPVTGNLMFNLGGQLRYGTKTSEGSFYNVASGKHTTNLFGLDVPLFFNYTFPITGDLKMTVLAGAKASYGFMGKTKHEGNVLGISGGTEDDWYDANGMNRNRFNLSGITGVVFSFNQFRLFYDFSWGFLDMDNNDNTKTTISSMNFGLGIEL